MTQRPNLSPRFLVLALLFVFFVPSPILGQDSTSETEVTETEEEEGMSNVASEFLENSLLQDNNQNGVFDLAAFGDSIVRGVGDSISIGQFVEISVPPEGEAGFPLRIENLLGADVSNLGDPGERLATEGVFRFAVEIPARRPDIVFISGGSNDAFDQVKPSTYFRSVQTMVNIAQAVGTQPILVNVPPACCNRANLDFITQQYNAELARVAAINDIPMANVRKAFTNTCEQGSCFLLNLPEGLHPNTVGYDVMSEIVIATLLNLDLFTLDGRSDLELALNLPPNSLATVPDPDPEMIEMSEASNESAS